MITGNDIDIDKPVRQKMTYPFEAMTKATNGGMDGLILLSGMRGGGKSSLITDITAHIANSGNFIWTRNYESSFDNTLKDVRLYMADKKDIRVIDSGETKTTTVVGDSAARFDIIKSNILSCNIPSNATSLEGKWAHVLDEMKNAYKTIGCKYFLLDNLSCIASTSTSLQSKVVNQLNEFIESTSGEVCVMLVAHLKKGSDTEILGSANIENLAYSVWIHNRVDRMAPKKRGKFLELHNLREEELNGASAVLTCTKVRDGGDINVKILFKYDALRKKNIEIQKSRVKIGVGVLKTPTSLPKPKKQDKRKKKKKETFFSKLVKIVEGWN